MKCEAQTRQGTQCKNNAQKGGRYCSFHNGFFDQQAKSKGKAAPKGLSKKIIYYTKILLLIDKAELTLYFVVSVLALVGIYLSALMIIAGGDMPRR